MTNPRLSTVYDYSNLRLHPDGTRVYQNSSNLRPDHVKFTTQDPRSNWIATDAGGSGTVRKVRKRVKDASEEQEHDLRAEKEGGFVSNQELSEDADEYEEDGSKRKRKRLNKGKLTRQKFSNDDSYLEPDAPSSKNNDRDVPPEVSISEYGFPEPSADLLKCIHRFASEFYTERGQLLNISREYRKERKERALRRRARREKQAREDCGSSSGSGSSDSESSSQSSPEKNTDDEENDEDEEGSSNSGDSNDEGSEGSKSRKGDVKGKRQARPKRRRRRHHADNLYTDMYKMFDGSAIMALGMLVQEQIAQMLRPQIPDDWKQDMESVYGYFSAEESRQLGSKETCEEEQFEQDPLEETNTPSVSPAEYENVVMRESSFGNESDAGQDAGEGPESLEARLRQQFKSTPTRRILLESSAGQQPSCANLRTVLETAP